MIYGLIIIFGLVMGSFFLVLADRGGRELSIIKPRSHCEACDHVLSWYELIPVFSYIFLGGRCKVCKYKISILCPIVELATAILYILCYCYYGPTFYFLTSIIIISISITIFISDFKYLIILDSPIIVGTILALIVNYFQFGLKNALIIGVEAIILFLFVLLIKLVGDKVFKRESLGGGDVKLTIFMGTVLGLKFGLMAFIISSFLALPVACLLILKHKNKEIPFGPFLILATLFVFIFSEPINTFLLFLFS